MSTGLSLMLQDCTSWSARSPQLRAFSHLLLGCCNAGLLRQSRKDVVTVLNSMCTSQWDMLTVDSADKRCIVTSCKPQN